MTTYRKERPPLLSVDMLTWLAEHRITLQWDETRGLRVELPKGAMTPDVRAKIVRHLDALSAWAKATQTRKREECSE